MQYKAETLNIRTSSEQKAKLALAASLKNMNLSQFVLSRSLEAADEVIENQGTVSLSAEDYDEFLKKLDEPPKDIPYLRQLLGKRSILEP